jgi:hypothetical protein
VKLKRPERDVFFEYERGKMAAIGWRMIDFGTLAGYSGDLKTAKGPQGSEHDGKTYDKPLF